MNPDAGDPHGRPHARTHPSAHSGPRLVISDFDRTVYADDSGTQLITWLLSRKCWRLLAAVLVSPLIAPLWIRAGTRRHAISAYLWIGTVGIRGVDVNRVVERFAAGRGERLRRRLRREGVDALRAHRGAGDEVVVLTGAPAELVKRILAADFGDPVRVIGSTCRRFLGGLIIDAHCYGRHKLVMLHETGYTAPPTIAYSDSKTDLPVLSRAFKPIVINPRGPHIRTFRRALGADVEIRHWSEPPTAQ